MGFWDDLTGKTAANASRAAAQDTYNKQTSAVGKLLNYGDQYASSVGNLYQPYAQTGATANTALQQLLANPSSVRSLPGYQFAQEEGIQALDRSAASRGMLNSGRASKDLLRFGTGLADQTYGNQLQRLMGGAGLGMQANSGIAGGLQGQLGARTTAYGGDMASAGTIGQGDIAAANARAAGSQNIFNGALKLGGMALAPFTGGASLGMLMGGGNSMSGGGGGYDPNTNLPLYSSGGRPLWA